MKRNLARRPFRVLAAALSLALSWPAPQAHADVPRYLNYQGKLADASGNPLTGSYCFVFRIWDSLTAGSLLFGPETWGTGGTGGNNPVSVVNGIYSLQIGSLTAGGIAPSVFDNPDAFLELAVNADPVPGCAAVETLSPREHLVAVPYAVHSLTSEKLGTGVNIATFTSAGLMVFPGGVNASTMTLSGSAFSVGGSTLVVAYGNVGIGTAGPSNFKLQVAGTVGPNAHQTYNLGSSTARWLNIYGYNIDLSNDFYFKDDNAARIFSVGQTVYAMVRNAGIFLMGGNVGIGTTSPSQTLHVAGNIYTSSSAVVASTLTVQGNAFSVGGSSFTVFGGSATVAYGWYAPRSQDSLTPFLCRA